MKKFSGKHIILIAVSLLILLGCVGIMGFLLFSNYQNVSLLRQAQSNFQRGDADSLAAADAQLRQLIANDDDNEAAYIMLGEIAGKQQIYPEQVYFCYMAHKLNPLSAENRQRYIRSLLFARNFGRLENFFTFQSDTDDTGKQLLLYAAGRNGSFDKYKNSLTIPESKNNIAALAFLLFGDHKSSNQEKLDALKNFPQEDAFLKQEIIAAQAELQLADGNIDQAEKALLQAYELNPFAFAPALGRFYINFRSFGKGLPVFEKYLATYHDQAIAMQTAEIYCLLGRADKIAGLRQQYQSDDGGSAMLCCYYFDALAAMAKDDQESLKELTVPLRKSINTPLAAFMFFCVDIQDGNPAEIRKSYAGLLSHRPFLDLQSRADDMVSALLKRQLTRNSLVDAEFIALANLLYRRKPEAFTAKLLLLDQRNKGKMESALLQDALSRFHRDPGINKIAIEYYLENDRAHAGKLITAFRKNFPEKQHELLRYEIAMAMKNRDFEQASRLFQAGFSPEIAPEYWKFASTLKRENDLQFLSREPLYAPFCQAVIKMNRNEYDAACSLLEKAEVSDNEELLFFAAKTLAENGRNQAALAKYALFKPDSPYQLAVLMNCAELYAENGDLARSLEFSARAYHLAPDLPEAMFCYAGKLKKNGSPEMIPDVVKITSPRLRTELTELWIAGMEARIRSGEIQKTPEKLRSMCEELLRIDRNNVTAGKILVELRRKQLSMEHKE